MKKKFISDYIIPPDKLRKFILDLIDNGGAMFEGCDPVELEAEFKQFCHQYNLDEGNNLQVSEEILVEFNQYTVNKTLMSLVNKGLVTYDWDEDKQEFIVKGILKFI